MAENFVSSGNDDGKRQGQTELFEKLINRIESLKTFIAKTANCVGFVADGLESESSCVEGASVILHTLKSMSVMNWTISMKSYLLSQQLVVA